MTLIFAVKSYSLMSVFAFYWENICFLHYDFKLISMNLAKEQMFK